MAKPLEEKFHHMWQVQDIVNLQDIVTLHTESLKTAFFPTKKEAMLYVKERKQKFIDYYESLEVEYYVADDFLVITEIQVPMGKRGLAEWLMYLVQE
jgi:hypothetical protein